MQTARVKAPPVRNTKHFCYSFAAHKPAGVVTDGAGNEAQQAKVVVTSALVPAQPGPCCIHAAYHWNQVPMFRVKSHVLDAHPAVHH